MARAGVTYHDVAKTAEAIKSRGQEPTVDRVREQLGTGSKSTIAPLLKRWRSAGGDTPDIKGLPNDLVEVVKSLHERVQEMADHRIEQARQEFKILADEHQNNLRDANNTIVQLAARNKDLEEEIGKLTNLLAQKTQDLETSRLNLLKAELQRDEITKGATELRANLSELKQENRDIRDHFEHYQQRIAEDRHQEREQFRAANQQLQGQLQELRSQLTQSNIQISHLTETNQQEQQRTDELEKANAELSWELNEKAESAMKLEKELDAAQSKRQEHQTIAKKLTQQLAAIERQKAATDKEAALLLQSLETTQAALESAQKKVEFLTGENKIILQEKAVIQGQFQQLQASL
jgi:chromosome segregation ATPase